MNRTKTTLQQQWCLLVAVGALLFSPQVRAQSNACDLAQPYGTIDTADVDMAIGMALGSTPCAANIAGLGVCNVVVVQRVTNATLPGGTCVVDGLIPRSVSLNWTASMSSNVVGYNIYRGTTPGGPYAKRNSSLTVGTTFTDNNVQGGQTYYYVTTAVNNTGVESVYSNEAKAVIPSP